MKKIFFIITLLTTVGAQAGGWLSKEKETPPPPKTITGFIALIPNKWPELAGYPELCITPYMTTTRKLEEAFKKKLSPETLLLPVATWNEEQPEGFSARKIGVRFPEHLDFEMLKNIKENDELKVQISTITFLLTAKQTTENSQVRFEDVLKNQIEKALKGHLIYDVGKEKEELIKNGILEKEKIKDPMYSSLHLLTEKHRKPLEQFLEEQK
jgi:hypothetical protein